MIRYNEVCPLESATSVALGCFDGLHIGHFNVLNLALEEKKKGLSPVIFTFSLDKGNVPIKQAKKIMTTTFKKKMLENLGFEHFFEVNFEELKDLSPEDFVEKIIYKTFNAKVVCCGFNYHFGKGGKGDVTLLKEICKKYDIEVKVASSVVVNNEVVSSTAIRKAIIEGDIKKANHFLGHPFTIDFEVVYGNQIGRKLGTPTINQPFYNNFILPKYGVYASHVVVDGKSYVGVCNVGVKPTVGSKIPLAETWIIGFSGDLYGKRVEVSLIEFLREEKKFQSIEILKEQILKDGELAKKVIKLSE